MFGLFMGIALGVGGIVGGIKKAKDLNDIKNWSIGHSGTGTYYDLYKGTDRDIRTDKPVNVVKADNGTGHTLVVDRSSGSILRNVSLEEKRIEFQRGKGDLDSEYGAWLDKGVLMYNPSQIRSILRSHYIYLDKLEHYSKEDEYLSIYRHFRTGRFCLKKTIDQDSIDLFKDIVRQHCMASEVTICNEKDWDIYYDIITGKPLDVQPFGSVMIKFFSIMDNATKEIRVSGEDMKKCISIYITRCEKENIKYFTSLSKAFIGLDLYKLI